MTTADIFNRLLDETAALIADPGALVFPTDELHTEILLPLLPAMLRDRAIREAWREHSPHGFLARMQACRDAGGARPAWEPDDFEFQVTASYLAEPDAKALADTLLSEPSLRDLAAALMNQVLEFVWAGLPQPTAAVPEPSVSVATVVPALEPAGIAKRETDTAADPLCSTPPIPARWPGPPIHVQDPFRANANWPDESGLGMPAWRGSNPPSLLSKCAVCPNPVAGPRSQVG